MKKLLFILMLLTSFCQVVLAGGGGGGPTIPCSDANPFCTSNTYNFPNETNTSAPTGPNYGCLGSEPNPVWYFMEIDQGGPMTFTISQSSSPGGSPDLDVDYALWGPFSNLSSGCSSVEGGSAAPIGCSYSTAPTETVSIANAQAGMTYILIITNYDGGAGYITFNQTGGSGVADCAILTPCDMTNLTATPSACAPATNTYSVSGQITFVTPPATGTLTVSSSCGGTQTFNAPFTSPQSYNLTGLTSNGANCTVTATFSADNTCTRTQNYLAPAACLPCNMTGITANVGACNPATNLYAVSGNVSFSNPPSTGTLTITGSCGGTQTYNAPFTSPANYNFAGLTSNGAPCTVTAVFSANAACTISQNYTAPANCTPPCIITNLTANIGTCQGDNSFPVNGTFTYNNNPGTGTVTVSVTNSSGTQTQVFNPPFVNGTTYNYNITTNNSDGSAITVTVQFSNAPACTMSLNSTSPPNCQCPADIGTFTTNVTGSTTNNNVLCYGDAIDITANGDYTPANQALAPPNPGGYQPGITWLVYSCPPSVALVPSTTQDIPDDPCLIGMVSDFDLNEINDQYWMTNFPGVFTNNTVYFVPITMYNLTEGLYSYVNTAMPCYELGTPVAIQYLPEITFTQSQTCVQLTATINGGLPAINGSQFTASGLTPANASFANTTCNNGGTIQVTGLNAGQNYSFTVTDANGCPITVSGTFVGGPTLSYPVAASCPVGTLNPTITGTTGGTYTSTPTGLTINATTGVINLATSTAGSYTITYTTPAVPGPACPATFNLTVHPLPTVVSNNVTVCQGGTVAVTAAGASTYSWSPATYLSATTGASVNFVNGVTTNYTVTGTSAQGCINTDPVTVTVNGNAPINAGPDVSICIGASTVLNGSGGVSYTWSPATGLSATNISNPTANPTTTQTYTLNGTDINGCLGSDQVTVTVNPLPAPVIQGPSTYCSGNTATLGTSSPFASYSWSTGGTGATVNVTDADNPITVTVTNAQGCSATSPAVNVTENAVITYNSSITICQGQSATIHGNSETVAGVYSQTFVLGTGCDSVSNVTLVVNPLPAVNAGIDQAVCFGTATTLTATGASTYVWTNGITNGSAFNQAVGTVTYTVTGTDANGCVNTDQADIVVNAIPTVNAGPDQTVCQGTATTLSGSGASTYSWNNGISNGVAFTQAVGLMTYTVTGTSAAGCTATDQVNVLVNPNPTVTAGVDVAVCQGQSVTLTGAGASTYTWDNGVVNGVAFVPTATTTYTVTGTTAAGCTGTDQVQVVVNPIPVITFTPSATSGCTPITINLTNTTSNSVDCNWSISNGTILQGCGTVPVTFTQGGCYDVTLTMTDNNGCIGTTTTTDLICVEEPPVASFVPSATQLSTLDTEVQFNNTTTGASNYVWSFGDGGTSSVEHPSHVYPTDVEDENSYYTVLLTASSPLGCTDTASAIISVYEELIYWVPNTFTPDEDKFNPTFKPIFVSGFDPQTYTLYIYNRWGELIFESHNAEVGWDGSYGQNGEIKMCQDGTYTWKIDFKVSRWDERKIEVGHVNLIR